MKEHDEWHIRMIRETERMCSPLWIVILAVQCWLLVQAIGRGSFFTAFQHGLTAVFLFWQKDFLHEINERHISRKYGLSRPIQFFFWRLP